MSYQEQKPVILVVYDTTKKYLSLIDVAKRYEGGKLWNEFNFEYCDCFKAVQGWYVRNRGKFVSLLVIGVDFSKVDDEQKLVTFPYGLRPAEVDVDIRFLQGFIIYHNLRTFAVDQIAPVVFDLSGSSFVKPERFVNFVRSPGLGGFVFAGIESESCAETVEDYVLQKIDQCALRPINNKRRIYWQKEHSMVVGRSRRMAALVREIERLAPTDATVLIIGPAGAGKELVARALHRLSFRYSPDDPTRQEPLVVNIPALERNICLDELFGHEAGAFTDAKTARAGIFESARGSTVFLDEIGEIDQEMQKNLLRVIEYHRIKRLGSSYEREVDVRIIAATNRRIEELQERFRFDFYTRMVQQFIVVPSIKERWMEESEGTIEADVADFLVFFVDNLNQNPWIKQKIRVDPVAVKFLTQIVIQHIQDRHRIFTGNVRSLRSVIQQAYERAQYENSGVLGVGQMATAVAQFQSQFISPADNEGPVRSADRAVKALNGMDLESIFGTLNLAIIEREVIKEALAKCQGNQSKAARILGIHRDTLRKKIKEK